MNTGKKWRDCFLLQFIIVRSLCFLHFVLFLFYFTLVASRGDLSLSV